MTGAVLECDIGNTRCKWRLLDEHGAIVSRGVQLCSEGFATLPAAEELARIRVACVAKEGVSKKFAEHFAGLNERLVFAETEPATAGVSNAYGDKYPQLGVDRWLALVAAYRRQSGAVLVVDVGSAITVDVVDGAGCHLGGYIAPGAQMMEANLLAGTGKVRFERSDGEVSLALGESTAEAVAAGVMAAQLGVVNAAIEQSERRLGKDFAILLTGGGASPLCSLLSREVELVPELVLDGLVWALP